MIPRPAIASLRLHLAAAALLALPARPALAAPAPAHARLEAAIARIAATEPARSVVAWVYFTDRAGDEKRVGQLDAAAPALSPRALERRAMRGTLTRVDASDLPVHEAYLHALTERGAHLRGASRWLNAASVELSAGLAAEVARWPFVSRVEFVPVMSRIQPVGSTEPVNDPADTPKRTDPRLDANPPDEIQASPGEPAYYGGSWRQLSMMQVPELHALGLSGQGVLVCILDAGFRTTHDAFASLNVLARRDFVNGDSIVDVEPGQDGSTEASHGTMTLGCVAGSLPGVYSGGAFHAAVALGKTEYGPTETPVEMDYWQFGAEWADSLGADVISSSLGYYTFDSPWPSYTVADLDGRTMVVTRAAVEAMRRGITVVNSAGNEGATPWQKVIGPADADTVIAVGAVDSFNVVTSFSSLGPTADGRIKPDVTAMGRSVLVPSFSSSSTYSRVSGTSFSAPLTAGLVALLLEAHPGWSPVNVRDALRETALNHASPDTVIGWGLVQGLAARDWAPLTADVGGAPRGATLALAAGPNPLRAGRPLAIRFSAPAGERVTLEVLDLGGRRVAELYRGMAGGAAEVRWGGVDARGRGVPAGVYFVRLASSREMTTLRTVLLP